MVTMTLSSKALEAAETLDSKIEDAITEFSEAIETTERRYEMFD